MTIVLNIWKRKYLREQLTALTKQTVLPKEIWIVHYETHFNIVDIINLLKKEFPSITIIDSSKNLKFFGRFSIAINIVTKFTWVLDDDIIPGPQWLERCCQKCDSLNSIISCTGRVMAKDDFQPENGRNFSFDHFIGDVNSLGLDRTYSEEEIIVDYACQSYFFKTEWLKTFWSVWPITFLSGEDIHLSATCNYLLNVKTVVLKQTDYSTSGSVKKIYGGDEFATFKRHDFLDLREKVFRYHILEKKWKPILW